MPGSPAARAQPTGGTLRHRETDELTAHRANVRPHNLRSIFLSQCLANFIDRRCCGWPSPKGPRHMTRPARDPAPQPNANAIDSGSTHLQSRGGKPLRRKRFATAVLGALALTSGATAIGDASTTPLLGTGVRYIGVGRLAIALTSHDGFKLDSCDNKDVFGSSGSSSEGGGSEGSGAGVQISSGGSDISGNDTMRDWPEITGTSTATMPVTSIDPIDNDEDWVVVIDPQAQYISNINDRSEAEFQNTLAERMAEVYGRIEARQNGSVDRVVAIEEEPSDNPALMDEGEDAFQRALAERMAEVYRRIEARKNGNN